LQQTMSFFKNSHLAAGQGVRRVVRKSGAFVKTARKLRQERIMAITRDIARGSRIAA